MRGNYIYRNDTIYRPPSNKCPVSNKRPRLSNLFLLISLPILLCIPTEQAASLQWAPYTNKRPYFVSVIALLIRNCYIATVVDLRLIALLEPPYKNGGLLLSLSTIISMWMQTFFKRMISS